MTTDLILGTAGHIDHGKSSLIGALTGAETDRLPEEKRRGITIELGFAELEVGDFRLGIVDVPGHERFVRNMLAGATGMDVVLLVVAADDSVKPQTREHFDILRLLDLEHGVVALTKCDLADPDWTDLVEEEVRELARGSFLEDAPFVRTSTATRQGVDELRQTLQEVAAQAAASDRMRRIDGPFRLAIDRSFSIAGHGTVVTGSISSGRCATGDELVIQPGQLKVRIRGLQNHDRPAEEVHRGQRAAINLAGIDHDQIERGHELAAPGHLVPSRALTVELTMLPDVSSPLRHRMRVRTHVGTAELMSSVLLLDREELLPGDTAAAQLLLSEPAATVWGQPFVIRSESPVVTLGGGKILDPDAQRLRKVSGTQVKLAGDLAAADSQARAAAAVYFRGFRPWQPRDLSRLAGIEDAQPISDALAANGTLVEIQLSATRTARLHHLVLEELSARVEAALSKLHDESPLRSLVDRAQLESRLSYLEDTALLDAALERMEAENKVRVTGRGVQLAGRGPQLTKAERKLLEELIRTHNNAGIEPPTMKELTADAGRLGDRVPQLLELAAAEEQLVEVSAELHFHADAIEEVKQKLAAALEEGDGLSMSEIREVLGTTRKYAVPLCEYLDKIGFTRRQGDVRVLGRASTKT